MTDTVAPEPTPEQAALFARVRRMMLIAGLTSALAEMHIFVPSTSCPIFCFSNSITNRRWILSRLPPIEEDPRDERTDSFREALINARITDEPYLAAMEAVDRDADDYLEKTRAIERALKDSVRAQLGF